MPDPLSAIGTLVPHPQTEQARPDQVQNNAGGWGFAVDDWGRALRFLVLGTEGGTYYVTERDLTRDNAAVILRLANDAAMGPRLVDLVREVSLAGRAPKQNPTLFTLAACAASADLTTRQHAYAAVKDVCRTGTHLFLFVRYVRQFKGWSRGLRSAIANWYTERPVKDVAYQVVKYREREGWSHRDLLRVAHPSTTDPERKALFDWVCRPGTDLHEGPGLDLVAAHRMVQQATTAKEWAQLAAQYHLPWEALPDEAMNQGEVWEALLPSLGLTALVRQLGRLTKLGVVGPMSAGMRIVRERLADPAAICKARLHPLSILTALATYKSGTGFRGSQSWTPVPQVIDALDEAFYLAFGAITPAGKRTLVALDVSGSMTMGQIAGSPLRPFEGEAAMAMTVVRTEPEYFTMAFSGGFVPLALSPRQRLDDVLRTMSGMPFDRTDCAVPIQWAAREKVPVDTFVIYTDTETWAGTVHPFQALKRYRDIMGIQARMAVVGMTSTGFSIADPTDRGMMDIVGFDTAVPELLASFSRGEV